MTNVERDDLVNAVTDHGGSGLLSNKSVLTEPVLIVESILTPGRLVIGNPRIHRKFFITPASSSVHVLSRFAIY